MSVRVRMFAVLREAAGTGETTVDPATVPQILTELSTRFGEPFATMLGACTVLVDGRPVRSKAETPVPAGAEVALLPPASGGGSPMPQHTGAGHARP